MTPNRTTRSISPLEKRLQYGNVQPYTGQLDPATERIFEPYLPSAELIEAVNLAIYLKRPLLIKGEPGSGKTRLAFAVANELNLPLETWYIKSTSRGKDGLYTYDTVGRLRDVQLVASNMMEAKNIARISDSRSYIRWGPIGRAFQNEERTVLLIDEIDKADIDFPNDLLLELDEGKFYVEETGEYIQAKSTPIVLITSNDEKELPPAFLRRCLFHYIEFPNRERLSQIVSSFFPDLHEELLDKAIERFLQLRAIMETDNQLSTKKVSTSELIDWLSVLRSLPANELLEKLDGQLPFPGVLLKSWEDQLRYLKQ